MIIVCRVELRTEHYTKKRKTQNEKGNQIPKGYHFNYVVHDANGLETISEQLKLLDSGASGFVTAIVDILPTSSQASIKSTGQQISTNANKGCVAFGGVSC